MTLEIRKIVANVAEIELDDVGVVRGDNMTFISLRGMTTLGNHRLQLKIVKQLKREFTPGYVHLGLIRFL